MTLKLFFQAVTKVMAGIIIVGLLIFLSAGTFSFFGGWLLMAVLFIPMFFAGVIMMIKNPELLKRRLDAKEKQKEQGLIIKLCAVMFISGFILSGIDFRFGLSNVPKWAVIIAVVVFLIAYLLYAEVIRENAYLSRTITVCDSQKVIDKGLYGVIRHPMYFATILLFSAMPIILGSFYAFLIFAFYPFIIAKRIKHEEEFLSRELEGYEEYKQKVRYRLIPFIW